MVRSFLLDKNASLLSLWEAMLFLRLKRALLFFSVLFSLSLSPSLFAQYEDYSDFEEFDTQKRLGLFHVSSVGLQIRGRGFQDVQISDYEATPMDSSDVQRMDLALGDSNYDKFEAGLSLGFITMKLHGWGGGFDLEYLVFENPSIIQYAAFLNYGILSWGGCLLGTYAKIGRTEVEVDLTKAEGAMPVRLSEIERLQGRGPVDIYDGNKLSTESKATYAQFGLQLIYRAKNNLAFYFQLGYQNEINVSKEIQLKIEGQRTNPATMLPEDASSHLEFDDRSIVIPNTETPARLEPELTTGPWYFSLGIGYPFYFD